jgi:RNA polymerase sigma factor (sigma-70 family)
MSSHSIIDPILARRSQFKAFLISRLGSEADADDVLQNGLMKAMRTAGEVRDEEKLTAWFYQLLRNAIVDHIRSHRASEQRDDAWVAHATAVEDRDALKTACACFESLLTDLKPREAELVRRIELGEESVAGAARSLGMSANSASVALHRARKNLRERLEVFCGECATAACLDCDCAERKN